MAITPSLRHCSNKYKLAGEGEKDKEKDEDFFFFFFLCNKCKKNNNFIYTFLYSLYAQIILLVLWPNTRFLVGLFIIVFNK